MRGSFKMEGAEEARRALGMLSMSAQRGTLMRVLRKEIQPLAKDVEAAAPYKYGDLKDNLLVGTRITKRQKQMLQVKKATAELHFGTADPAGMMEEYGLGNNPMRPFFRPVWERTKRSILSGIEKTLGGEIMRTAERAGRKAARLTRKRS